LNFTESHAPWEIEIRGIDSAARSRYVAGLAREVGVNGRLVGVTIDGKEYPPVDMMGAAKTAVHAASPAIWGPAATN